MQQFFSYIKLSIFLILLGLLSSCAYKKISYKTLSKNIHTPIFIQMPESNLVFDNISPIVYKLLQDHFCRVGYHLVSDSRDSFLLKVKIKYLFPAHKFISPDVLVYDEIIKIELFCQVFDKDGKILAQKTFYFSSLICRPSDPILNSGFWDFEYRKLMEKVAPQIEQYFRKYWIK